MSNTPTTPPTLAAVRGRLDAYRAGPNEKFEAIAAVFYERTGMLAPGKDDASGMHTHEQRRTAWIAFTSRYANERLAQSFDDTEFLLAEVERLREALRQIADGEVATPYKVDRLERAHSHIEGLSEFARNALNGEPNA